MQGFVVNTERLVGFAPSEKRVRLQAKGERERAGEPWRMSARATQAAAQSNPSLFVLYKNPLSCSEFCCTNQLVSFLSLRENL